MLVNHPQCWSAAALMNVGPQTALSVPRYSPIMLENRIQLPATLSLQRKTHPALLSTRLVPPDHISRLPVIPPAANLSQDLTFRNLPSSRLPPPAPAGPLTCITCCSFSQFDQLRFQYRCESAPAMVKIHLSLAQRRRQGTLKIVVLCL